jgi:hypothetical protein
VSLTWVGQEYWTLRFVLVVGDGGEGGGGPRPHQHSPPTRPNGQPPLSPSSLPSQSYSATTVESKKSCGSVGVCWAVAVVVGTVVCVM